ncbi:MAG TPA: hypothetical protein VF752_04310 [Thermoleophilaceae bacterium]
MNTTTRLGLVRQDAALRIARPELRAILTSVGVLGLAAYGVLCWRIVEASFVQPRLLVPSAHRHFPLWMRGVLRANGSPLPFHDFLNVLVALTMLYVVIVVCARAIPALIGLGAVAALTVLFTLAPPLLSTDVFNYIAYSRAAQLHGLNPYVHGPAALPNDPVYPFVGHLWNHVPSAYGPLFTLLTYELEPLGIHGELWALKAIAGAACIGCVALVWLCAKRLEVPAVPAALFFGLNPLVLVWGVGGAHNDMVMTFALLLGLYLLLSRRPALGGAALTVATAVKLTAGLALPFAIVGVRPRWRVAAGALMAAGVGLAITYAEFGSRIRGMLDALRFQGSLHFVGANVPGYVGYLLGHPTAGYVHPHILTELVVVGSALLLLRTVLQRSWLESTGWALLLLLVTASWILPWYVVWALPMAALARRPWLRAGAVALTGVLVAMQISHLALIHDHHHRHRHHHHRHHHALVHHHTAHGPRFAVRTGG